jgi:hypothetical protein
MTATTFGRLERGRHTRTERLQAVADAFEVPLEHVLMEPSSEPHISDVEQLLQRKIRDAIREEFAALRAPAIRALALEAAPATPPNAAEERAAIDRIKRAAQQFAGPAPALVARKQPRKRQRKVNG